MRVRDIAAVASLLLLLMMALDVAAGPPDDGEWPLYGPRDAVGAPEEKGEQPVVGPQDYTEDPEGYPVVNCADKTCYPAQLVPMDPNSPLVPSVYSTVICRSTCAKAKAAAKSWFCPAYYAPLYSRPDDKSAYCDNPPATCVREPKVITVPAYSYAPGSKNASVTCGSPPNTNCVTVSCSYTVNSSYTHTQKYIYYDCQS